MFGDWRQDERVPFKFAPDLTDDAVIPLAQLVSLRTIRNGKVTETIKNPVILGR